MAITFVAASSVGSGATMSITPPAGYQEGDLFVVLLSSANIPPATPTGWTRPINNSSGITVYTKYASATETAFSATANTGDRWVMLVYRGAGSYDVIGTQAGGSGTTATPSTIVTTYANDLVLTVYATNSSADSTFSVPSGTTSRANAGSTVSLRGLLAVDEIQAAAGTTTARASTISATRTWNAVSIAFAPTRTLYWVGGAGTWNTTTTGDWANTSGGSPTGILPPVQNENVIIDSNSGTGTITCTAGVCKDLTVTASQAITLGASGSTLSVYGNFSLPAGGSFTVRTATTALAITFAGNSSETITTNGKTLGTVTFNGVGGTWTLQDALTTGATVTLTAGTLNLNSNTLTANIFSSNNSATRAVQFGTGNITVTGSSATILSMGTVTGFSYTGTPNVISSYAGGTGTRTINFGSTAGATEANAINLAVTAGTDTISMPGGGFNTVDFTGFAGTLNPAVRTFYGNVTLASGMTVGSGTNTLTLAKSSGTQIITANGVTVNVPITKDGASTLQLQDALTLGSTRTFTLTTGTLDLNNFSLTAGLFSSSNNLTRAISFGTASINVTSTGTVWTTSTSSNLTVTGTKTVNVTNNTSTAADIIAGSTGFSEANAINFNITAGTYTVGFTGSIGSVDFTGFAGLLGTGASSWYGDAVISTGMTILSTTNAITFAKTSGTQTLTTNGKTFDRLITKDGAGTLQLQDALTLGSTRTFTLTRGTLELNNFSLTAGLFSTSNSNARTIAFGSATINLSSTGGTVWNASTSSNLTVTGTKTVNVTNASASSTTVTGGTPSQTNAISFNFTAGTYPLTLSAGNYGSLDFTGFAGSLNNSGRTIYGNVTFSTGMTITGGGNIQTFAKTSGTQTLTTNNKGLDFPVTKTGAGTLQLQGTTFLSTGRTFTLTEGSLDLNSTTLALTCDSFSSSNTNTRAIINPPASTPGIQVNTSWTATTATNFTPNGVNIRFSDTSTAARTFDGGGATYGNLSFAGSSNYVLTVSGNNSFNEIFSTKTSAFTVRLTSGSTQTVTNWNLSGTSGNVVTLDSTTPGSQATISQASGTVSVSWCNIKDSNATGGASFQAYTTNNNVDSGNNTGWIFTAPPTSNFGMLLMF